MPLWPLHCAEEKAEAGSYTSKAVPSLTVGHPSAGGWRQKGEGTAPAGLVLLPSFPQADPNAEQVTEPEDGEHVVPGQVDRPCLWW